MHAFGEIQSSKEMAAPIASREIDLSRILIQADRAHFSFGVKAVTGMEMPGLLLIIEVARPRERLERPIGVSDGNERKRISRIALLPFLYQWLLHDDTFIGACASARPVRLLLPQGIRECHAESADRQKRKRRSQKDKGKAAPEMTIEKEKHTGKEQQGIPIRQQKRRKLLEKKNSRCQQKRTPEKPQPDHHRVILSAIFL